MKLAEIDKDEVSLRGARSEDAEFILRLEEAGMREYAIALWGSWRASATVETIDLGGHRIATLGSADVGCVATDVADRFVRLGKLYIAPNERGRGVGSVVLGRVLTEAGSHDMGVRLSVLTTNPAVGFYRRAGFRTVERTAERIWMEVPPPRSALHGGKLVKDGPKNHERLEVCERAS